MVLYHVITTYHLMSAMTHQARYRTEAVLMIPFWFKEKFPRIGELEKHFTQVVFADAHYRFHNDARATAHYYRSLIGDPAQYTDIYVWGAQYSFGISLAEQNAPFTFCEEGAGVLSRPQILENIDAKLKEKQFDMIKALGLFDGSAACVKKRMCNISAQTEDFCRQAHPDTILHFDIISALSQIDEAARQEIIGFFVAPGVIRFPGGACLLLTQQFASLKILSFSQQVLLYQLAVDYFFSREQLVIKPHPDDIMYYRRLFPEAQIIRERFPSEFLPFILDHQPDCVATVSSTAIFNLRGHYPRVFELDTRYEKQFPMTHRYFAAVTLAQRLGLPLVCEAANEVLAQRLGETLDGEAPAVTVCGADGPDGPFLLLIDDVTGQGEAGRARVRALLDGLPAGSCAVLLNTQGDFCWYDYDRRELWAHMAPLTLEKRRLAAEGEDFYAPLEDETIYIYSQDKELLDMAKETRIEKELPHTGLHVSTAVFTPEQERIKMLEGILAATERRLLYYIEKEREAK